MKLFSKIARTAMLFGMLILSGVIAGCGSKKEESYRSIQVYDIDGTGWVTREGIGEMELYANMQLQSNDQLRTENETYVQLKLDEDKYILLEPNTSIKIEAEGNAQDSKTKIVLEEGSIVNRIENKLSENSSYEVETPSSTMAVRGTTFKVKIVKDSTGKWVSEVDVQNGKVDCRIIVQNEDGTVEEQVVSLEAGKKTIISGTPAGADYVSGPMEYTYDGYENEVLDFIGYSKKKTDDMPNSENGDSEEEESVEPENKEEESKNSEKEDGKGKGSQGEKKTEKETTEGNNTNTTESENAGNTEENESDADSGSSSGSVDSGNTDSGTTGGGSTDSGGMDSGNTDSGGTDSGGTDSGDSGSDTEEDSSTSYTVTFGLANGEFATQTVISGNTATKPVLMPDKSGKWSLDGTNEFDFSTKITEDIVLLWVE